MSLAFLAPWMLGFAVLVAAPVAAHLTGFREVRQIDFPTLRFLRASEQKLRRRRRLESLALLLLRCLIVLTLVFLFAQPQWTWTARAAAGLDPGVATLVLVDRSASMSMLVDDGSETVFEAAVERAQALLDGLAEGTPGAVMTFDGQGQVLVPGLTADRRTLRAVLGELEVGAGATDLGRALRRGRDLLLENDLHRANLFVLSDGRATALPTGLSETWPDGFKVQVLNLGPAAAENRFVVEAEVSSGTGRGGGLQLEVVAESTAPVDETLALRLSGEASFSAVGDIQFVGGRAKRSFQFPIAPSGSVPLSLELPADDLALDDAWPLVVAGDQSMEVLLISGDGGSHPRDDETYYLQRALEPGAGSPSRIRPRVVSAERLQEVDGGPGDVIFLCNVANPAPLVDSLLKFVESGGGLVMSMGDQVDLDRANELLAALLPARFTEVKTRGRGTFEQSPVGLSLPALEQPEFRVFRTGGTSSFSRVRFGRLAGTEPALQGASEILLRTTDGLPILLSRRVGKGRVLLFTSSLDDDWTDLPLRGLFVPLVHQLTRSLAGSLLSGESRAVEVGEALSLPVPVVAGSAAWVVDPRGRHWPLDLGAAGEDGQVAFRETHVVGHYALYSAQPGEREASLGLRFAARVPLEESRLKTVDEAQLLESIPGLILYGSEPESGEEGQGRVIYRASGAPHVLLLLVLALVGELILARRRS